MSGHTRKDGGNDWVYMKKLKLTDSLSLKWIVHRYHTMKSLFDGDRPINRCGGGPSKTTRSH